MNQYYNLGKIDSSLTFTGLQRLLSKDKSFCLGSPLKIFYSKEDALKYRSNGRTYYAPKLPFSNIRIPVTYINNINTNNLPDFNFNTGSLVGKAEADVQADIDLALKNYLDHLIELNNNKPAPVEKVYHIDYDILQYAMEKHLEQVDYISNVKMPFANQQITYMEFNK